MLKGRLQVNEIYEISEPLLVIANRFHTVYF